MKNPINQLRLIYRRIISIDNIYLKFILTVIAISLIVIAIELDNRNYYGAVDIINGSVRVNGSIDVSGEMDTYEQNNL